MRYTNETLIDYCKENTISLLKDYENIKINRESYIDFCCINKLCNSQFNKNFRQLVKTGAYCEPCMKEISNYKIKILNTKFDSIVLEEFCNKNSIILNHDYSNEIINRDTIITGKCLTNNCENQFIKPFRQLLKINGYCENCSKENGKIKIINTNMEKYGVKNASQSLIIKLQSIQTNLKKYGVEYVVQSEIVKNKIKKTNMEKYGVEYTLQLPIIREQIIKTNLEKYGVENPQQNKEIKDKTKKTNLEKYGVENYFQSEECKQKIINTTLKKYGVEHHSQNAEIAELMLKNSYLLKKYTLPSGIIIDYQGYENYAFDELLFVEKIKEDDLVTNRKGVPVIWYYDKNNKQRRHYVDIYIKSQNRCIEVKSTWTNQEKNNVFEKQKAAHNLGLLYDIWIYDSNGNKIESYS
jgi:hypothetical protein